MSKLVAGRAKDFEFTRVLLAADLVEVDLLCEQAELLPAVGAVR